MFVDGHQVVGFAPRFRELPLQELIEGLQVVQASILSGANFTQIPAQIHEADVAFLATARFPRQDLVDLGQHKQGSPAIELGWHQEPSFSRQKCQANQGQQLSVYH